MQIISRILDWLKPDRVIWRTDDKRQELFRQRLKVVCNLADSNEKIAQAFFTMVERGIWSMEDVCDAVVLLPPDRYKEVNDLLESMFAEVESNV